LFGVFKTFTRDYNNNEANKIGRYKFEFTTSKYSLFSRFFFVFKTVPINIYIYTRRRIFRVIFTERRFSRVLVFRRFALMGWQRRSRSPPLLMFLNVFMLLGYTVLVCVWWLSEGAFCQWDGYDHSWKRSFYRTSLRIEIELEYWIEICWFPKDPIFGDVFRRFVRVRYVDDIQ